MNNQMPYGFMPNFGPMMNDNREIKMLNDRIDKMEGQIKRLEKKVAMLEQPLPMPYNGLQNNYSI